MTKMSFLSTIPELKIDDGENDFKRDGLIYCGKCGTPRQVCLEILGQERVCNCLCKCRSEQRDREDAAFKQQQELDRIRRMRSFALSDPSYRAWTFDADDGREPKMQLLRRYTEKWDEVRQKRIGLLLWGDVGTGKSYGAACVVNALTDRGVPCLMTTFISIANEIDGKARNDKNGFIASLNHYPLLVLDDLGAERNSEYMQEMVFEIVDARYRSGLPIIVTTNISLEKLKNPENVTYSRIYDRILEMAVPVKFTKKRRAEMHAEKHRELTAMLTGREAT